MDHYVVLILIGFAVGTLGTLIGAGGGFILVPLLILTFPHLSPEVITAISMAVVACNATSGTFAYIRSGKVDFKAGLIFAICTVPGSILGVISTRFIPRGTFDLFFGFMLIALSVFLFLRAGKKKQSNIVLQRKKFWVYQVHTDKGGQSYTYSYDLRIGIALSVVVGYLSPLLGIGGGVIHVPALTEWLHFPVHLATATSHFILAIMATVSVIVHITEGVYNDALVMKMVIGFAVGVIPGAQLGAILSRRLTGNIIVKALAVSLALVGVRILLSFWL